MRGKGVDEDACLAVSGDIQCSSFQLQFTSTATYDIDIDTV